jgi:hypothetical protein
MDCGWNNGLRSFLAIAPTVGCTFSIEQSTIRLIPLLVRMYWPIRQFDVSLAVRLSELSMKWDVGHSHLHGEMSTPQDEVPVAFLTLMDNYRSGSPSVIRTHCICHNIVEVMKYHIT